MRSPSSGGSLPSAGRHSSVQITPGRFLLGPEPTVLDLYAAVASRWTPHRARFHQVAPRMGEVMRRVDALPELREFWTRRFPFEGRYAG